MPLSKCSDFWITLSFAVAALLVNLFIFVDMNTLRKLSKAICLVAILSCVAFSSEERDAKGIQFFKGNFKEALEESRKSGKPIFIDVYADWCGPCKQLKRSTFKDASVGDYFNKNFICIGIDGETDEGKGIRKFYDINSYPTLLITNSNGKLLTRAEGFMKPYILINFGRRIVPN